MTHLLSTTTAIAITLIFVVLYLSWAADLDEKRFVAYQKYDQCVLEEYFMTPIQYHEQRGVFPYCDVNN